MRYRVDPCSSPRVLLLVAAACCGLSLGAPPSVRAQAVDRIRLDGIAAVAGARAPGPDTVLVLRSDVALRARISLLRAGAGAVEEAPLPRGLLQATLNELIGEALIAAEAQRLGIAAPSASRVRRERQRFLASAGGEQRLLALLRALGASERELARIVERRAVVEAFLDANLEGVTEVTQAELERAYAKDDHPFRERSFEEVKESLRAWLVQRRLQASVARWVEALKQRMPYRVLASF